jgi:hypothetical protein
MQARGKVRVDGIERRRLTAPQPVEPLRVHARSTRQPAPCDKKIFSSQLRAPRVVVYRRERNMMTLFVEGGWPMWFTVLFGLVSLGVAARYARSGSRRDLGFVTGMSLATLFSIFNGVAADLSTVGHQVNAHWDRISNGDNSVQLLIRIYGQGFAESMSPAIFGFTLLSLTWLIAAVGLARRADV